MTLDPSLVAGLRLGLAGILAISTWQKLRQAGEFRAAVAGYLGSGPLRRLPVAFASNTVLAAEAVVAIWLCAPGQSGGAYAAAGLFVGYALLMAALLVHGRTDVDCGCSWGVSRQPVSLGLVLRNLLLAALGWLAAEAGGEHRLTILGGAGAILTAAIVLSFYAIFTALLANASNLREARS
ncbi:MauE/DoxX family redox-associated membrane protein [Phenylobacterium sp.]|uniref:MauE/DoxX family redox-associated membrane protein n=1 Tax=Phenylobacterium sp. TaxID=1871053 RepID=UPI0030F49555